MRVWPAGTASHKVKRLAEKRDLAGLIDALDTEDGKVQVAAAEALGKVSERRDAEFLLDRLKSIEVGPRVTDQEAETQEEFVWGVIAGVLAGVADPENPSAETLLAVVEWPDGGPSRVAMEALAEIGDRRVIEPILRRLEKIDYESESAIRGDLAYICEALGTSKRSRPWSP